VHGCGRRKRARQGLGLGFKEKRREREMAVRAMAIGGHGDVGGLKGNQGGERSNRRGKQTEIKGGWRAALHWTLMAGLKARRGEIGGETTDGIVAGEAEERRGAAGGKGKTRHVGLGWR
jgi:hypothetical protein